MGKADTKQPYSSVAALSWSSRLGQSGKGDNKDDGWGLSAFPGLSEQGHSYLSHPCASYLDYLMRHLPQFLSQSSLLLPTLPTSL